MSGRNVLHNLQGQLTGFHCLTSNLNESRVGDTYH